VRADEPASVSGANYQLFKAIDMHVKILGPAPIPKL